MRQTRTRATALRDFLSRPSARGERRQYLFSDWQWFCVHSVAVRIRVLLFGWMHTLAGLVFRRRKVKLFETWTRLAQNFTKVPVFHGWLKLQSFLKEQTWQIAHWLRSIVCSHNKGMLKEIGSNETISRRRLSLFVCSYTRAIVKNACNVNLMAFWAYGISYRVCQLAFWPSPNHSLAQWYCTVGGNESSFLRLPRHFRVLNLTLPLIGNDTLIQVIIFCLYDRWRSKLTTAIIFSPHLHFDHASRWWISCNF